MTNTIQTVSFHGQQLAVIPQQQKLYVAIKPICENIGVTWGSQYNRIKRNPVLCEGIFVMKTPSNGGEQETTCLPLEMLNGWLFGIDTNRIKNEKIKERVIQYQRECYQVLFDYWTKGTASNPRQPDLDLHYPAERWQQLNPWLKNRLSLSPNRFHLSADLLYGPDANTPINHLITQLSNQGHDMQACWMELMAMRHHLETARNALSSITRSADYATTSTLSYRLS